MIIAIDGLTASGKGTLARMLAAHLRLPHLDTGLLYRALALKVQQNGLDADDGAACAAAATDLDPAHFAEEDLRSGATGQAASQIAAHDEVRQALFCLQRRFAQQAGGAVLDGRDIGTVICPEAEIKFWVHADLDRRAARRHAELLNYGSVIALASIAAAIKERDIADATRSMAPARQAEDAIAIDTSQMNRQQMLQAALAEIARKSGENHD